MRSVLLLMVLLCLSAFGQRDTGALRGRVLDQTGGAAVGVAVQLQSNDPGAKPQAARTDDFGDYRFANLTAGTYTLSLEMAGFTAIRRTVSVTPGTSRIEDLLLEVTSQTATVVVRADAAASLARAETPIIELPQSVQVIDEKVLSQQQVVRLENVFRNVSGVNQFSAYQDFNVRGFRSNEQAVLYNGSRAGLYTFWTSPMLANIDRVEVLKGPASVLYGSGQPGGLINLVTKKPEPRFRNQIGYTFGQFNQHRSQIDSTGPMNRSRTLLYRVNGAYFNSGSFRWFNRSENYLFTPAITWAGSERSRLTFEAELMKDNRKAQRDRGILAPGDNVKLLPAGFTSQEPSDFQNNSGDALQLHYLQSFGATWTFNATARHTRNRFRDSYHEPRTFTPALDAITRQFRDFNRFASRRWLNAYTSGIWQTGTIRHALTFGFDLGFEGDDIRGDRSAEPADGVPNLSLTRLDYGRATPSLYRFRNRTSADGDSRQYAFYARDQLDLTATVKAMLGVRITGFKDRNINFNELTGVVNRVEYADRDTLAQAGLVWLPRPSMSLYANFAESFLPQGTATIVRGGPFQPERGRQFEFGGKREWLRNRLSSTLAFFQIGRSNVLVTDPNSPAAFLTPIGRIQSRGVELDILGKISDRLNITANYAYLDAKVVNDTNLLRIGRRNENAPRNATNVWAYYQFPFWNLSAGGGFSYVTARPTFETLVIPGYFIGNATLSWQRGPLKITATMDNLANRRWFLGGYHSRTLFPGTPRVWLLSAMWTF